MRFALVLHLVGWACLAGLNFAIDLGISPERAGLLVEVLADVAITGGVGCAISSAFWWRYRRIRLPTSVPMLYLGAIAGALAGALLWFTTVELLDWWRRPGEYESALSMGTGNLLLNLLFFMFFPMLAWHVGGLALRQIVRAARAEELAQQARLEALRYQLNPHFLFNALNSAIALIEDNPGRAQTMLTRLSGLLRHTLRDAASVTTLEQELDVIDRYIEIERVRFEDKLRFALDIAEPTRRCGLPPLLLHALVENAVKYGMRTSPMPLQVRLNAVLEGDVLRIGVCNTGHLERRQDGVGLRNVRGRLEVLYPGRHRFSLDEVDGQVHAVVEIRAPEVLA